MPLPLSRQGPPKVYLPGYKSVSRSGFDRALQSFSTRKLVPPRFGDFEQGQLVKAQSGGVQANLNEVISLLIKAPAYAAEAPLRPYGALAKTITGSETDPIADFTKGVEGVVGKVPILSNILGGLGEGLHFLDNVGASLPNKELADRLASFIGKPDS